MDSHYLHEVLKGNTEAFGHFVKTYQNKAFGIAMSIVKHEDDAKDVVQESFIHAYSSISKYRFDSKFSTWLYRIVVNTAMQLIKHRKRKEEILELFTVSDDEKSNHNNALKSMQSADLKKLIKQVFGLISSKEALVLQLFYIENLAVSEIEEVTEFSTANIKVLLYRGRQSFYKVLRDKNIKKPY